MLQSILNTLSNPYVEVGILLILLLAFLTHRKDPRLAISGLRLVRVLILLVIFVYLMLVWLSAIARPALAAISVFGMWMINMVLLYYLILARLLRPYHNTLTLMANEPQRHELLHQVWHTGKRFYYVRYAWSSLFSGVNPAHFLHEISTDRVRDDIRGTLRQKGGEQNMLSLSMMVAYLKSQIACDTTLPADFQHLLLQATDDFAKHPYIQEKAGEFLHLVMENPEDLNFPEWTAKFESCVKS